VSTSAAPARYERTCLPPYWARGGHAQTIASHFAPSRGARLAPDARTQQVFVDLADGDRLSVLARRGTSGVRVLVMHGLSGDTNADYVRRLAAALDERGHGVWAVDHRGCGFGRGLARRPYHSGRSDDLSALLRASRSEAPDLVHVVVGYSMSGNIALLHAGRREQPSADGVVAVNPPVDLARASRAVSQGLARLYDLRFVRRLARELEARHRAGLLARRYRVPLAATLCDFDELFTAPEGGFASAADYHARCSARPHLAAIATPTAIVTSADDPFVDPRAYDGVVLPSCVRLHVEASGGHVGYLERGGPPGTRWIDGAVVHYVEAVADLARAAAR
jgi:hypothetical protein